jgi:hypothetical protein
MLRIIFKYKNTAYQVWHGDDRVRLVTYEWKYIQEELPKLFPDDAPLESMTMIKWLHMHFSTLSNHMVVDTSRDIKDLLKDIEDQGNLLTLQTKLLTMLMCKDGVASLSYEARTLMDDARKASERIIANKLPEVISSDDEGDDSVDEGVSGGVERLRVPSLYNEEFRNPKPTDISLMNKGCRVAAILLLFNVILRYLLKSCIIVKFINISKPYLISRTHSICLYLFITFLLDMGITSVSLL